MRNHQYIGRCNDQQLAPQINKAPVRLVQHFVPVPDVGFVHVGGSFTKCTYQHMQKHDTYKRNDDLVT